MSGLDHGGVAHLHLPSSDMRRASILLPASLVTSPVEEDIALFGGPPPSPDVENKVSLTLESSVDAVGAWLHEKGLEAHCSQFSEHGINGVAFSELTLDQIKQLGVTKIGDVNRLLAQTAKLKKRSDAALISDQIFACFQWQLLQLSRTDNESALHLLKRVQNLSIPALGCIPAPLTPAEEDADANSFELSPQSISVSSSSCLPSDSSSQLPPSRSSSSSLLLASTVSDDHFLHGSTTPMTPMAYRTLRWRRGLGDLTDGHELEVLTAQRERYLALCKKYLLSPGTSVDTSKMDVNDPLSLDKGSSWFKYFNNLAALDMIRKDVSRTELSPEFDNESTHQMMETLLLVWSLEHPQTSYRQGMNDLVAIIMMALCLDQKNPSKDIMEPRFLEADTYSLFDRLMGLVAPWYTAGAESVGEQTQSPLFKKLQNIHNTILRKVDPAVWEHLTDNDVAPQLYLLRWIRVLFAREFNLSQILLVWDAIMEDMDLVDFVCVAMVSYIRFELVDADATGVLQRLLRYPSTNNVQDIITLAQGFQRGGLAHSMPSRQTPSKIKSKAERGPIASEELAHLFGPIAPDYRVKKHQGYLVKKGATRNLLGRRSFKRRWFLYKDGELFYSKSPEHAVARTAVIELRGRALTVLDKRLCCFQLGAIEEPKTRQPVDLVCKVCKERFHSTANFCGTCGGELEHATEAPFVVDGFSREYSGTRKDPKPRRVYQLYAPNPAAMEDWIDIVNSSRDIRLTSFD